MALAGGEALIGLTPFRDYLSAGALDIVQPDLALCGGFSEALRIAALADAFEVPLIPHVWGTGINFCASLQFTAVLPDTRARASAIRCSSTTTRSTRCATRSAPSRSAPTARYRRARRARAWASRSIRADSRRSSSTDWSIVA